MNGDNFFYNTPQNALLQASTELKDKTSVGLFVAKNFDEEGRLNFGLGLKKALNDKAIVKAKIDKDLNAAVFTDYKFGAGIGVQTTVARNFSEENSKHGFLGSNYAIGLKVKYDC